MRTVVNEPHFSNGNWTLPISFIRNFLATFGLILWLLTPLWSGLALIISAGGLSLAESAADGVG